MRVYYWFSLASLVVCGLGWVAVMVGQLTYPGFVGVLEGDSLQHIERLVHGQPIYVLPQGDFVSLVYMPLYYILAAPLYMLCGDSFLGPRLLSALAAVGAALVVGRFAWRATSSHPTAWLAMALYFASYQIMDAYSFSALPDSLVMFWILLGSYFLLYGRGVGADLAYILCFCLAFWTKQVGAMFAGFGLIYAFFYRENHVPRPVQAILFLLGGGVTYFLMGPLLGDRFFFYTWTLPGQWERSIVFPAKRTIFILACFVPAATLLSCFGIARAGIWSPQSRPVTYLLASTFLIINVIMMGAGSSNNVYMPLIAVLCTTAAIGAHSLLTNGLPLRFLGWLAAGTGVASLVAAVSYFKYPGRDLPVHVPAFLLVGLVFLFTVQRRTHASSFALIAVLTLICVQLAASAYDPRSFLPSQGYRPQLVALREELATLDGPVAWLPFGNAPSDLTGRKLARVPSWVVLQDIERQISPRDSSDTDLSAFHDAIHRGEVQYLLANSRIGGTPGWEYNAADFELIRSYEDRFSKIQMATKQWYASRSFPRFLYQYKSHDETD